MRQAVFLSALLDFSRDGEWGKGEPFDNSVEMKVIRGTDFGEVRVGILANVPIRHVARRFAEYKTLQPNDILLETAGGSKDRPTGRSLFVKPSLVHMSDLPLTCASFARFLRIDPSRTDPRYVFWHLQYLYHAGYMFQYHTQHTGVSRFQYTTFSENEPLYLPPLPTQRKIAAILSTYDDLIENNTRRIAILEDMAQAIYHEWFVNFRFPGHEGVRMVESELGPVPEGWEIVPFSMITKIERNGINPSQFGDETFAHYSIPAFDSGRMPFREKGMTIKSNKYLVLKESVLLSKLNPRIPRVWLPALEREHRGIASTEFLILIPKEPITRIFLFSLCSSQGFLGELENLASGTSTSHQRVKPDALLNLSVVLPPKSQVDGFSIIAAPTFNSARNLRHKNAYLRQTRDLLLPRLVSGELDVSELDIDIGAPDP
jgi:type I restriction enzyme S subunit